MGYQDNPTVYGTARFTPSGTPLDLVVPTGATGLYVSWLFGNVLDRVPADLFVSRLSNTVARFALGESGAYIGVADVLARVSFENLGTPALFSLVLEVGFDLNDVGELVTGSATEVDRGSNQDPFVDLRVSLNKSRNSYTTITQTFGKTFFDASLRITQSDPVASKMIRVGESSIAYTLIERLSRDS